LPLPDTDALRRRPLRPADFPDWTAYYWNYQYQLTVDELIPCLRDWGVWREGVRILDVGCGDGGATCALAENGAVVAGLDIEPRRLEMARERARSRGLDFPLVVADITDPSTLNDLEGPWDLVLFRDVLEHIPDVDATLEQCVKRLADGGAIVVIYPPYWSPYGGHQQTLRIQAWFGVRWAKFPFIHWLPSSIWRSLAEAGSVGAEEWEDIAIVRRARLTIGGMATRARRHGLEVSRSRRYLLRPTFRLRYGTPVVGAGWLGRIPGLREMLVTGAWEMLRRR
jgi:SAM-dependent methyltransferase